MTPLDMQPFGLAWCLKAIGNGLIFASPFLVAWYFASDFHTRGLARLRRHNRRSTTR